MTLRTHELHPTLVHLPLALIPTAIGLDLLGRLNNDANLMRAGKMLMPLGVLGAAAAGLTGYAAQNAVRTDSRSRELLVTHRNLNTALLAVTAAMAVLRQRRERPGLGYLMTGIAGVCGMAYTAYLGGKMVYTHGVGVEPRGVDIERSPELVPGQIGRAAARMGAQVMEEMRHSVEQASRGEIAPVWRAKHGDADPHDDHSADVRELAPRDPTGSAQFGPQHTSM